MKFQGGIQTKKHKNPGKRYRGDSRRAYLPNTKQGREALELSRIAFNRKLIFTIGQSLTTHIDNCIVWNGIHFKTNITGGEVNHGYPDNGYFDRFKDELKSKGVTVNDLNQHQNKFIQNG